MKLRPLDDRIIVRPEEAEEKTAGGIVANESSMAKATSLCATGSSWAAK